MVTIAKMQARPAPYEVWIELAAIRMANEAHEAAQRAYAEIDRILVRPGQ